MQKPDYHEHQTSITDLRTTISLLKTEESPELLNKLRILLKLPFRIKDLLPEDDYNFIRQFLYQRVENGKDEMIIKMIATLDYNEIVNNNLDDVKINNHINSDIDNKQTRDLTTTFVNVPLKKFFTSFNSQEIQLKYFLHLSQLGLKVPLDLNFSSFKILKIKIAISQLKHYRTFKNDIFSKIFGEFRENNLINAFELCSSISSALVSFDVDHFVFNLLKNYDEMVFQENLWVNTNLLMAILILNGQFANEKNVHRDKNEENKKIDIDYIKNEYKKINQAVEKIEYCRLGENVSTGILYEKLTSYIQMMLSYDVPENRHSIRVRESVLFLLYAMIKKNFSIKPEWIVSTAILDPNLNCRRAAATLLTEFAGRNVQFSFFLDIFSLQSVRYPNPDLFPKVISCLNKKHRSMNYVNKWAYYFYKNLLSRINHYDFDLQNRILKFLTQDQIIRKACVSEQKFILDKMDLSNTIQQILNKEDLNSRQILTVFYLTNRFPIEEKTNIISKIKNLKFGKELFSDRRIIFICDEYVLFLEFVFNSTDSNEESEFYKAKSSLLDPENAIIMENIKALLLRNMNPERFYFFFKKYFASREGIPILLNLLKRRYSEALLLSNLFNKAEEGGVCADQKHKQPDLEENKDVKRSIYLKNPEKLEENADVKTLILDKINKREYLAPSYKALKKIYSGQQLTGLEDYRVSFDGDVGSETRRECLLLLIENMHPLLPKYLLRYFFDKSKKIRDDIVFIFKYIDELQEDGRFFTDFRRFRYFLRSVGISSNFKGSGENVKTENYNMNSNSRIKQPFDMVNDGQLIKVCLFIKKTIDASSDVNLMFPVAIQNIDDLDYDLKREFIFGVMSSFKNCDKSLFSVIIRNIGYLYLSMIDIFNDDCLKMSERLCLIYFFGIYIVLGNCYCGEYNCEEIDSKLKSDPVVVKTSCGCEIVKLDFSGVNLDLLKQSVQSVMKKFEFKNIKKYGERILRSIEIM